MTQWFGVAVEVAGKTDSGCAEPDHFRIRPAASKDVHQSFRERNSSSGTAKWLCLGIIFKECPVTNYSFGQTSLPKPDTDHLNEGCPLGA
jgi:hypothetical protein